MTLSPSDVWTRLLDQARTRLPDHTIDTWLAPLTAAEYADDTLTLNAPDQFSVEWNEQRHTSVLESVAPMAVGHPVKIQLRVQAERLQRSQMDLFVPAPGQQQASLTPQRPSGGVTLSALNER